MSPDTSIVPGHSTLDPTLAWHHVYHSMNPEIMDEANRRRMDRHSIPLGMTALHISAENGHEKLVRTLLRLGADPDIADSSGNAAIHYAARSGHTGVVLALLDGGANVGSANKNGWTAMHLAGEKGFEQVVQLLIGAGADINFRGGFGIGMI
jgi:ankyrin repeat protein